MTTTQKIIKYLAIAFALFLVVSIIGGICKAVSSIAYFFDNNTSVEMTEQAIVGDFSAISVNLCAAELDIQTGEQFNLKTNHKHLKCETIGDILKISEKKSWFSSHNNTKIILTIPKGVTFDYADIDAGAGSVTIDELSAKSLSLDLGAGELKAGRLNATGNAEIDGGAGSVTINTGYLNNADIDMGVGALNLTSELDGKSSIDYGIGETNLVLLGTDKDYKIEIDKGIGEAWLDGQKMSDDSVYGSGSRNIEIDGGVGELNITFAEQALF